MRFWDRYSSWEEAEEQWDKGVEESAAKYPLKTLPAIPKIPGIAKETKHRLTWKTFKYLITQDTEGIIRKNFLKHPIRYGRGLFRSFLKRQRYRRDGDFFLYGFDKVEDFYPLLEAPKTLLVVGFSYCHKPFECPATRFSDGCISDPENPVCRQCFLGKMIHALPAENVEVLIIPTIHYVGKKIFEILDTNPSRKVVFLITACELALEMFSHCGNMVDIQGVGVRLGGRFCNTMRAFEFSEKGTKPGLTVVGDDTKKMMLEFVRKARKKGFSLHNS